MGGIIALGIAWLVTLAVTKWLFPASLSVDIVIIALLVSLLTGRDFRLSAGLARGADGPGGGVEERMMILVGRDSVEP